MKHFRNRLFGIALVSASLFGQGKPPADATGCSDSTALPKLLGCRIDNCERKESDQRRVPVRENEKGEPVTSSLDGESRSVMYECAAAATPASIVQQAGTALRTGGFAVLYQFTGMEGTITARKDDLWILLEAASHYYTLVELKAAPPDFESINDAVGFADAIDRYGRVAVYGIHFGAGKAELLPDSNEALKELAAMLDTHPDWRVRIEAHTDNSGNKMTNMTITTRRAAAVATALAARGVKRLRLEVTGLGDTRPIADNSTEEGRAKNERIEVVKLAAQ